jgi:Tol biopolymer transport system component
MFPGRWLPTSLTGSTAFGAPQVRWRLVGVAALLLLALVAGLALIAGSQRHLPAPFGLANNGVVAYEQNGDIYVANPVTGIARTIVTGTRLNVRPVFSGDGSHLVFEQLGPDVPKGPTADQVYGAGPGVLVVARSDGTDQHVITPDPVTGLYLYATSPAPYVFSPDGREVAFWKQAGGGTLSIAQADGSGVRAFNLPFTISEAAYRPPDGAELIVTGTMDDGSSGVFAVDARTGIPRPIVAPRQGRTVEYVRVSPDGSRIAYVSWEDATKTPEQYRVHVADVDDPKDIMLPLPAGAHFQDAPAWSNDGTRLAIMRGYTSENEDMAIAIVRADGTDIKGVESKHKLTGCCNTLLEWSPDDTTILVTPETLNQDGTQYLLLDPKTAAATTAPWTGLTPPNWQRVAP